MKLLSVFVILVLSLTFVACNSRVKEVDEAIKFKEDVILEMGKKIEADPTEAGVDEARQVFESRKAELKAKSDVSRKAVSDGKVGGDQLKAIVDSGKTHGEMFELIRKKFGSNIAADQKFVTLINDFNALFK